VTDHTPIILWIRRDLRLGDHPALQVACATGQPVIPVFVHDDDVAGLGAAPKWRLGLGLARFAKALAGAGSGLVLRRGPALDVLRDLIRTTGARHVVWTRGYAPDQIARDTQVKAALKADGVQAHSYPGHLLFEPWDVATKDGGFYKVYTPMWRAVRDRHVDAPLPAPSRIPAPADWPASDTLADWQMGRAMDRGADVVAQHVHVGEDAAQARLEQFLADRVARYKSDRDRLDMDACSGLSENLTYGEISPRTIWHAGWRALQDGHAQAEDFLKELVWREFAYHLVYHTPRLTDQNWRPEWDGFPWQGEGPAVQAWRQGRTGIEVVDAAMRELYVTGRMHNRARMLVASFLTKHLMVDWRLGRDWFAECLVDWDPASNAMGWQWVAGSGPDAAPYFRIFNPDTQAQKFDPDAAYRKMWLAESSRNPPGSALAFFQACPRSWKLSPKDKRPMPIIDLKEGRERALTAYHDHREKQKQDDMAHG
jgi:deoxyribodipyrimidine photo-lyase